MRIEKAKVIRDSNLELYRIIMMFLIVCHHYVINSGLIEILPKDQLSANSIFYYLMGMWGKTGIDSFVMITGYFMCKSGITLRKFLKMYLQVIFYALVIYFIFIIYGKASFNLRDLFLKVTPFWNVESDSFISSFIVWWLFIPFLSTLVNNINKRLHLILIFLCVGLFSIYPLIPFASLSVNPICWFSTLFFVASYIRNYPECIDKYNNSNFWGITAIVAVIVSMASVIGVLAFYHHIGSDHVPYGLVSDETRPLAFLTAVITFIYFKNVKMEHSKIINVIGASTFGVLLIHANSDAMRGWLWGYVVDPVAHFDTILYPIYAIGSCFIVFIICSLIDIIRIRTIEKYTMQLIDKYIL